MDFNLVLIGTWPFIEYLNFLLIRYGHYMREKKYGQHVDYDPFTLEPWLRNATKTNSLISPRMLISVALRTPVLFWLYFRREQFNELFHFNFVDLYFGLVLMTTAMTLATNLYSLLIYKFASENPESLSGKVHFSRRYILYQGIFHYLFLFGIPLVVLMALQPSMFVFGCMLAIPLVAGTFVLAERRALKTP